MNLYAIQVKTRGEEKFITRVRKDDELRLLLDSLEADLVWPRRQLTIRKQGREQNSLSPIFPGYVFLILPPFLKEGTFPKEGILPSGGTLPKEKTFADERVLPSELYWKIRKTEGFYRFLKSNRDIEPLSGQDREILLHFLSFGEIVSKSEAYYDENQRIVVTNGPMKGMEGAIVKVDRRRKRAKIRLSLYKDSFLVDFGFDIIEAVKNCEKE